MIFNTDALLIHGSGPIKKQVGLVIELGIYVDMAIDANKVYQLAHSIKTHGLGGIFGMLGAQMVHPSDDEISMILNQLSFPITRERNLFSQLGFNCVESIDISDFEGSTHILDLNGEYVPDLLIGRFDVVYNGGTLEHIFDIRTALRNIFTILKPGGVVIHSGPTNGWIDHGFYQFSPTFFTDYYYANGFEILECQILHRKPGKQGAFVYSYVPGCFDTLPTGSFEGTCNFYAVFRKKERSTWDRIPQQRYYSKLYGDPETVTRAPELKYFPAYNLNEGHIKKMPQSRFRIDAPCRGIGNEWMVKLSGLKELADDQQGRLSPLQLWENEQPLGPPHSYHEEIRVQGGGKYSHWGNWLHFSTSDNHAPGEREYSISIPKQSTKVESIPDY